MPIVIMFLLFQLAVVVVVPVEVAVPVAVVQPAITKTPVVTLGQGVVIAITEPKVLADI